MTIAPVVAWMDLLALLPILEGLGNLLPFAEKLKCTPMAVFFIELIDLSRGRKGEVFWESTCSTSNPQM